uniref:Uncharacterized protein n=1 Tax=Acrobeloides nanus TaxID=290746 RepID=A0A914DFA5_9BILA
MESNILSTNVMQQCQNMFPMDSPRLPSAQTLLTNNPNMSACNQFSPQPAYDSADWAHMVDNFDNTYSFVHPEDNDPHYEGLSFNTSSSLSPTSWFSGSPRSIPNDPFLHSPISPAQNVHSPQIPFNRPNIQRLIKGRVIKLVKILKLPTKGEGSKKGTIGRPRGPSKQAQTSAQVGGVAKKAHQVKPKANEHNNEYHRYYAFDKYALTMLKMLQACKTAEDKTEMIKILEEEQGIIAIEDGQSMFEIKDGEELIETTLNQLAVTSTGKRVIIKDRNK